MLSELLRRGRVLEADITEYPFVVRDDDLARRVRRQRGEEHRDNDHR